MKCRIALLLTIAVVIGLVAGCEEDNKSQTSSGSSAAKTEIAKTEPVEAKPVEPAPAKVEVPAEDVKPVESAKPATTDVKFVTSKGDIVIRLNAVKAPITTQNFVKYVNDKYFDGLIFHRVIKNFMIQGGGFTPDMQKKATRAAIINEASNGLKNARGTIAMARTNNPNSATSQFFINHKDNNDLNYGGVSGAGYAVFGKVIQGMDVVDAIAATPTARKNGMGDVPVTPIIIKSATVVK